MAPRTPGSEWGTWICFGVLLSNIEYWFRAPKAHEWLSVSAFPGLGNEWAAWLLRALIESKFIFLTGIFLWERGYLREPSIHLPRMRRFCAWALPLGLLMHGIYASKHVLGAGTLGPPGDGVFHGAGHAGFWPGDKCIGRNILHFDDALSIPGEWPRFAAVREIEYVRECAQQGPTKAGPSRFPKSSRSLHSLGAMLL